MTPRTAPSARSAPPGPRVARPGTSGGSAPRPLSTPRPLSILGLATVLLGGFLGVVDFFVVNVALPAIGTDLHASPATLQLVVAGYGIAYALLLVLGGRLGDHLGRRRMFLLGMAAFTVTRVACALAPTAGVLVAARVVQGAAAALMVPQVLATISATTTGRHRMRAMGAFGAMGGLSVVVGQLLGGVIVSADLAGAGWRPVFLVLVPLGVVAMALAWRVLPETRASVPARLDVPGTLLLGATLFSLLVPLTEGRALGWPAWTVVLLATAPVLGAAFVVSQVRGERRGGSPLVPPSLLRSASMRTGLAIAVPFFVSFGGFMFVFPVAVQRGAGLDPLDAGLALAPYALAFLLVSLVVGRLVDRFGRRVLVLGALVAGFGYAAIGAAAWLAWPQVTVAVLAVPGVVAGAGQASVLAPLFRLVLADVPVDRAGTGSGVLTTTQQTALAFGVATVATAFLALDAVPGLGMRGAFAVVQLGELVLLGLVAVIASRLPDLRIGRVPAPSSGTRVDGVLAAE